MVVNIGERSEMVNKLRIGRKLLIILLLVSIIPITVLIIIFTNYSTKIIRKGLDKNIDSSISLISESTKATFEEIDKIFHDYNEDESFIKDMYYIKLLRNDRYKSLYDSYMKFQDTTYNYDYILGLGIVNGICFSDFYDATIDSVVNTNIFIDEKYYKFLRSGRFDNDYNKVYSNVFYNEEIDKHFFFVSRNIVDINNYQNDSVGNLVIAVDAERFVNIIKNTDVKNSSYNIIIDEKGFILATSHEQYIGYNIYDYGTVIKEAVENFSKENDLIPFKQLYIKYKKEKNYTIVSIQDLNYLNKDLNKLGLNGVLIALILGILSFLISYYYSGKTGEKVQAITKGMYDYYQGNEKVKIELESNDEFSEIANRFNDMVIQINNAKAKELMALSKGKEAEIKSLEAQINPHFIYNTLDAINWVAIENEDFVVSRMVNNMAAFLRYTIHDSNEVVTIRTDILYLKKYMELQQERYEHAFEYELHIDEEVLDIKIHKLILQPLIENSIEHGFPNTENDTIKIYVNRIQDDIRIRVWDNGKGLPIEKVEAINNGFETFMNDSIGINNIITRINLYYGNRASYNIKSYNMETCFEIRFPME